MEKYKPGDELKENYVGRPPKEAIVKLLWFLISSRKELEAKMEQLGRRKGERRKGDRRKKWKRKGERRKGERRKEGG